MCMFKIKNLLHLTCKFHVSLLILGLLPQAEGQLTNMGVLNIYKTVVFVLDLL